MSFRIKLASQEIYINVQVQIQMQNYRQIARIEGIFMDRLSFLY